ncbi:MAG TPA: diphosphomevalonate decarboxylase [Dyella sp.]|uniref:diphosphomevalonate decarboxylase n=1 Tax=Dyella sp. TaxID=1869338 RepID=UPI002B8DB2E5|nr:diphosphomevalonate decarboxylase [Dyella sp.]HTV84529.1 diphosphomevalonate decarboxylase [Dyella sp.]
MNREFRADASGPLHAASQAQPNIALVKYWGKRDAALNLPAVGSISITLDSLWTRTEVRFVPGQKGDQVSLNGRSDEAEAKRITACLDLLRQRAAVDWGAQVASRNNFPTAAGLASSASGFAALVHAGANALGLALSEAEQSVLARRCSGSAARSIFGGYVQWAHGRLADGTDSVAEPLLAAGAWPLRVAVAITSKAAKQVGSSEGMRRTAQTSPYQSAWVDTQEADLAVARDAILARDFQALAQISEYSCLKMHALAMAAQPGLLYWNGATMECMHRVRALRQQGLPVFFTVDAGPQLKAVCEPSAIEQVKAALRDVPGVLDVLDTGLGEGAKAIAPELVEA